jgi:redox-sensing transcriptional repressor
VKKQLSRCGLFDCGNCEFLAKATCPGCLNGNLYLETWGRTPCSIFACARSAGIESCRVCANAVCALRGTSETVCPLRAGSEEKPLWMWRIAQHLENGGGPCQKHLDLPPKTLMRLRWYITALAALNDQGLDIISSRELADKVGVGAPMVRKDLSYVGDLGTPGLGYRVIELQERILGILEQHTCLVAWVGAQWLSSALSTFVPTLGVNFRIVAAFDTRPEWIGKTIGQWEVLPLSDLPALFAGGQVDGAVLALPEAADRSAAALIAAGAKGILNLTSEMIAAPPTVSVRHVDLIGEMMALAMEVSEVGNENCRPNKRVVRVPAAHRLSV